MYILCLVAKKRFRFDYNYYPEAAGWFKLHLVPANWTEARLRCDLEGAVLASPLNAKLTNAMKEVMANQVHCGVFSGIHATISKGDYFSIEGVPLAKIPVVWAPNEPDNFENSESCLMMLANGTMADVKCSEVFPYVCYKKDVDIVVGSCGTADTEYQLESRTSSCYKFHRIGRTSELEFNVLKEIYSKFPNNIIISNNGDMLFIGIYDWGDHNTWRTVHGETLQAAGFDKWHPGEPNNVGNDEFCGTIIRPGYMNDASCNTKLPFICEKSPTSINSDIQQDSQ